MTELVGVGGKIDETGYTRHLYELLTKGVGTRNLTGLQVVQRAAGANMSVDVSTGAIFVEKDSIMGYTGWVSTSAKNVSVTAADPSNPRVDRVVAYIDLSSISTAVTNNTGALKFAAVAGTPAGSPTAPNDAAVQTAVGAGNPFVDLAELAVAAADTSIATADITDKRVAMAVRAPIASTITTVTANTDLTHAYDTVKANANGGAISSLTLPDATLQSGRVMRLYKSDSSANTVTIDCVGSQTVNGKASYILWKQYSMVELFSDGTNWIIKDWKFHPFQFRAYKPAASTLALSAGVLTKVNFATESYDPNGNYDNATNYRYTAPVAGIYRFEWNLTSGSTITTQRREVSALYKNGSIINDGLEFKIDATASLYSGGGSARLNLAAGDYVEVFAFSGATFQVDGDADGALSWFSGGLSD